MSARRFRRAGWALAAAIALLTLGWFLLAPRVLSALLVDRINPPRFATPDLPHRDFTFRSHGAELRGWLFEPKGPPRGLVIHLHGRMYTRVGGIPTADVLAPRGYAVLAFDQRGHGASDGDFCTWGHLEKDDVSAAIDALGLAPVYLVGHSLGAAVALQAAASDPRIRAVAAASSFADLREAFEARVRGWPLVSPADLAWAERDAQARAGFRFEDVSPLAAAPRISVPVLLLHGALDKETPPAESARLRDALGDHARLWIAPDADHVEILDDPRSPAWAEIARFFDGAPR